MLIKLFIKFFPVLLIISGLGLIGYTISLGILSMVIETIIGKMMRLVPNSLTWTIWRTLPLPIYMKFSFFNVTNADQLKYGAKPVLKEMGPYTYLIDYEKVDITNSEENDTVRYRQTRHFFFQKDMSYGYDDDQITFINAIYLSVTQLAHATVEADFMLEFLDEKLAEKGEKFTKTGTVKQIVFDGVDISAYTELLNDPVIAAATEDIDLKVPEQYADGYFAVLKNANGSDEGWFEVFRGIRSSSNFAQIVSYNGKEKMEFWNDDSCNSINGTDGTIYPPLMKPEKNVQVFVPLVCRSLTFIYEKNVLTSLIPAGRYIGLTQDFLGTGSNPDNWCYCPKENTDDCNEDGIFHIDMCQGAPALATKPHFLGVRSNQIRNGVSGLNPNPIEHESYIDFHMLTGAPIKMFVRLQMSFDLIPSISMPSLVNVSRATVPFMWVEMSGSLDFMNTFGLFLLSFNLFIWDYFKWVMPILGIGQMITGMALLKRRRDADKVFKIDINKE